MSTPISARFVPPAQIMRRQWDAFVENSAQGSLYARSWYLDAVMPGWGAMVVSKGTCWLAVMPMAIGRKYGISYALQPAFSQYLGVLFAPFQGKSNHVFHKKREILEALILAIPSNIRLLAYNFSPHFDYFLPFLRQGFDIQPRSSLTLSLLLPLESIMGNFSSSILNHLKKAQQNGLRCREGSAIELLAARMQKNRFISAAEQRALLRLWQNAVANGRGFLLEIIDSDGLIHCSGLFLLDQKRAVFVASALDREKRQFGSNSLLVLEAIKKCQSLGLNELDFKGSIILGVEQFFLGFNPQQVLYLHITRNRLSRLEQIIYRLLKWVTR